MYAKDMPPSGIEFHQCHWKFQGTKSKAEFSIDDSYLKNVWKTP